MDSPSPLLRVAQESPGELAQRAFFGGGYLAFLVVLFLLFPASNQPGPPIPSWLFPILLIPGMIVAHVSYELSLPIARQASKWGLLRGFAKTGNVFSLLLDEKVHIAPDVCARTLREQVFNAIEAYRNSYVNKSPATDYYRQRILDCMYMRRTLLSLHASSVSGLLVSAIGMIAFNGRVSVGATGCALSFVLALATLVAATNRYDIMGQLTGRVHSDVGRQQASRLSTDRVQSLSASHDVPI
jgi:hypothetical protein